MQEKKSPLWRGNLWTTVAETDDELTELTNLEKRVISR